MAGLPVDKRSSRRYDVEADLRFSWRQNSVERLGWGRITELSDKTVCFDCGFNIQPGAELEIRIPWPKALQNGCRLELVARCSVIRNESERAVVHIEDYELLTSGERSFHQPAVWGNSCNIMG